MENSISFYKRISKLKWPASYSGKILLIAFIGTHIPLISLFIFLTVFYPIEYRFIILMCVLIATLGGTAGTLYFIYRVLGPIRLTGSVLERYRSEKEVPDLPRDFSDDAGKLMAQTQSCIEELDRLLKLKNHLISTISHDSRTPLGAINLAIDLVETELSADTIDREKVQEYLQMIEVSANSQKDFLNSMLSLARFDEGKLNLEKEKVSPDELFEKVKANHSLFVSKKDLHLSTHSHLEENDELFIDQEKVLSILNNLIQNAIKFTKHGGNIEVSLSKQGETHIIKVTDNGIGIPKHKQDELFKAFSSSRTGTDKEKGTGLGLWIAKVFTELHGGTITLSSGGEMEGTEVTITLPAN